MNQIGQEVIKRKEEISIRELIIKVKSLTRYLNSKWLIILISGITGGLIGLTYSLYKKSIYTATCTFVLEDNSRGGSLGQYAGLASLAGIDIGGGSVGGIFQGNNILELYKSRLMIAKTLLSKARFDGKEMQLVERYVHYHKLRKRWKDHDGLDRITFAGNPDNFNRKQDSIITDIVEIFNKDVLSVTKPDKKLSIIQVEVKIGDELFAKEFNNKLVQTVNDFYVQTKTKISNQNVSILQRQTDSVKKVLDYAIKGVASAMEAAPNANPALLTLRVPSQKKQVDVQANTIIYSEMIKNLELSKLALRQETPLIQIIDQPVLPLKKDKLGKLKALIIGGFLAGFLCFLFLVLKRMLNSFI